MKYRFLIHLALFAGFGSSLEAVDFSVSQSNDLQPALNLAQPGDRIILAAGVTFTGNYTLPYTGTGTQWITIQTSNVAALPGDGSRVGPADAVNMPTIIAADPAYPAFTTVFKSNHYRFVGLEIRGRAGGYSIDLVRLGTGYETSVDQLPHHFDLDRVYIHGDSQTGSKRGVAMNGLYISARNSYISDIKSLDQDTQTIMGWNGPGPYSIVNNYLEAAGENVMFGGATPNIQGMIPSNIEIRGNYFRKPLSWFPSSPDYAGIGWYVKTILELKNAANVTIDGNIFENCWVSGQIGFGITFTPRAENSAAPWVRVQDVTFTNNIVKNVAQGVNIGGTDDLSAYQGLGQRMKIQNNVFVTTTSLYKLGRFFQIVNGAQNVTFDHNTAFPYSHIGYFDGTPSPNLVYSNNLTSPTAYGFFGTNQGEGKTTLATYAPNSSLNRNVMAGQRSFLYPSNNFFPVDLSAVGLANYAGGDYSLLPTSPYAGQGTDGKDIGADQAAIASATATAIPGQNTPYVTSPFNDDGSSLYMIGGLNQSAAVGTTFPVALTVKAPAGASVTFNAPVSGASGTFAGDNTSVVVPADSTGIAQAPPLTANGQAGKYAVTATATGTSGTLNFTETNQAGAPASIIAASGDAQSALSSAQFQLPLTAQVVDGFGNPVSGVNVTFSVSSGGSGITFADGQTSAVAMTDASGNAVSPMITAASVNGGSQVVATAAGTTQTTAFSLTTRPLLVKRIGTPISVR